MTPLLALLADLRVLRIEGDDAGTWLQGQTTQDVLSLAVGQGAYTLFVLPTGKVRADAFVSRTDTGFDLVVDAAVLDPLAAVLDKYVVMEDVSFAKPALEVITVQDVTRGALGDLVARDAPRLGTMGFDVLVPAGDTHTLPALEQRLGVQALSAEAFESLRIRRGVARFGRDFGEESLPQEAGVAGRAVSFKKGCYIGQEPVVMLEHRGKPPKRMCVVRGEGSVPPLPAPLAASAQVGQLTSGAQDGEGFVGLALVKRNAAVVGAELTMPHGTVRIERLVGESEPPIAQTPG